LLSAVIALLLAGSMVVGLPGSGQVRVTVSMAGGPTDVSGNSVRRTVGHVEVHQVGRTVRRLTVPADSSTTIRLRPGLYQLDVTDIPGCGVSTFVLWGRLDRVGIVCSVK
jgi:hypothetical protein